MRISDWSSDVCSSDLLFIDEQQMVHPVFVEIKAFSLDTVGLGAVRQQANIAARAEAAALGMIDDDSADALILSPLKQVLVNGCHLSEERRVGKECVSTCRSRG